MQKNKIIILISIIAIIAVLLINNLNKSTKQNVVSNNQLIIENPSHYNIEARCLEDSDCTIIYGYDGNKCPNCPSCAQLKPEDNSTIAVRKDWKEDCPPKNPLILCVNCISPLTIEEFTAETKCLGNICHKILNKISSS